MLYIVKCYFASFIVFLGIDMIWLGLIAKRFYATRLGHLMTPKVLWTPAFIFYLLFVAGVLFFVVFPAIQKSSLFYALGAGALFGFISYATYDLTNMATLQNWPLAITLVDLVWGAVLSSLTSVFSYLIITRFF